MNDTETLLASDPTIWWAWETIEAQAAEGPTDA